MNFTLLIPKNKAKREVRKGFGGDFWKEYWEDFNEPERYAKRVRVSKLVTSSIIKREVSDERKLYAEVVLDEDATSKSKKPSEIWKSANIDIVKSRDGGIFTISGTKNNFKKLENIIKASSFEGAKTGEGIKKIDKNKFRELYAITKISDKNTGVKNRLSRGLTELLKKGTSESIYCIIEIYADQLLTDYDSLFSKLNEIFQGKIIKRDEELFFSNMSFNAHLKIKDVKSILENISFNFVSQIKLHPFLSTQRCIPNIELSGIKIGPVKTDEIVAIIDSGIKNELLDKIVIQRYSYLESGKKTDTNHGTFVASRAVFGNDIFKQTASKSKIIFPAGKILDVKVLYDDVNNKNKVDPDDLQKAIKEIVKRHQNVKIFNLSINYETQIEDGVIDELTQFLDTIAREYDVIIVCSAGNHVHYKNSSYDKLFDDSSLTTKIACPADALNVLTVGSIAENVDKKTLCKKEKHPSPFTRKGNIRNGWKKPDLVIDGGNIQEDGTGMYDKKHMTASSNSYGVEGIDNNGLNRDVGTSFSAPLVSNQCLFLLDYIKKSNLNKLLKLDNNYANLVKALLIHSTHKTNQADIKTRNKDAYGFGIPDYKNILRDDEDQFSFVYADTINAKEKKHKINFKLPDFLHNKKVEFIFTFAYNPPVNKNFPDEYKMVTLKPTLRTIHPKKNKLGVIDGVDYKTICTDNSWERYRNDKFNIIHFSMKKKSLSSISIEVLIQMEISDKYEDKFIGKLDELRQNYSMILTVVDLEENKKLNEYILSSNQFNVLVENSIQIQN